MKIETVFFSGLDQLELPRTSVRGERFLDQYFITNDRERIKDLVKPYVTLMGSVECGWLIKHSPAVVYRRGPLEIDSDLGSSLKKALVEDLRSVQEFLLNLWLIKDNAAFLDRGWMAGYVGSEIVMNNNTWEVRLSSSEGAFEKVHFGPEDFKKARQLTRLRGDYLSDPALPTMLTSGWLRYQRFMYFVQIARSSGDVATKLAQYCSGLEALVSNSQTELSHQVSERIGSLLEEPGPARTALYALVKEAYGYRSKVVHGASFNRKTFPRLKECSRLIDELCRRLAMLYLNADSGVAAILESGDEKMSKFFLDRILGNSELPAEVSKKGARS